MNNRVIDRLKSTYKFLACGSDKEKHDHWNLAWRIRGRDFLAMLPTASSPISWLVESVCIYRQVADARAYPCKVRRPRECVLVRERSTAGGCALLLNWIRLSVRERRSNRSGVLIRAFKSRPSFSVNCHSAYLVLIPFVSSRDGPSVPLM